MANQRITADTVLSRGPGYLLGAVLTPNAVASSDITFYDGLSASDKRLGTLHAGTVPSNVASFPQPVYFEHGLFVAMGANVLEAWVFYEPVSDNPPPAERVE